MGIRTKGFTKVSRKSGGGDVGEEKVPPLPVKESTENLIESCEVVVKKEEVVVEGQASEPGLKKPVARVASSIARSPLKIRTPASMARLGGMKAAARKLKKHRKKSLFQQSANKILRSSIKSNKTRRACRLEEKPRVNGVTLPSRISTRTCVRRSSREGIPEAPLRTVELIKRPLELREPATKLLYMASLGLYPRTGESDMTPIVVIKELNCSPGKKNGVRKSLELPLIPYHKRFLDLASHDKQSISENIMPGGKQTKRKGSPANKNEKPDIKKPASGRKTPVNNASPPNVVDVPKPNLGLNLTDNGKSNTREQHQPKKKTPPPKTSNGGGVGSVTTTTLTLPASKQANTLDLTSLILPPPPPCKIPSPFTTESDKLSPNSKSLLKSNISPPSKYAKDILPFSLPLNLTASLPAKIEPPKPITTESLLASACSVTQAMNLIMSNITILPTTSTTTSSRKRCANDNSSIQIDEIVNSKNFTIYNTNSLPEKKPPKKKQKRNNEEKNQRFSLPQVPMPISVSAINSTSVSDLFLQSTQLQNEGEALNLCMKKRNSEPLATPVIQLPPKLQLNSNVNIQKINVNGSKPLNLIIPRPPPLMKAPLEATNFSNCTQNVQPVVGVKGKAKKAKKSRQNNNQLNQSTLQIQQTLPVLPPLPLISNTDTTVHAKSLLKCMNGEENTCAREIGESLDSVKTMLSRLQTRIGPAVNGVRLITIE